MEWLWSPFTIGALVYVGAVAVWFALKLNRGGAVTTEHGTSGRVDAIEFFWRPG